MTPIYSTSIFMKILFMIFCIDIVSGYSNDEHINWDDCMCRKPNVVYLQHTRCELWKTASKCWDPSCDWKCKNRLTNSYDIIENPNHRATPAAIPVVTHQNHIDCTAGSSCKSLSIAIECESPNIIGSIECKDQYSCASTVFSCRCPECTIKCRDWYSCQHAIVQIEEEESGYFIKEISCSEGTSCSLFIS